MITEIVEDLLSHKITKKEAIKKLRGISDGLRNKKSITFKVTQLSYTSVNKHALVSLKADYAWREVEKTISAGDEVDVCVIPK